MNPLVALTIVAVGVAGTVTLMLLVRHFVAPAGGFFTDPDRAAGVFGVTGTGFAVLLAFVIFLSFSSYDRARDKASTEAVAVTELFSTAKLFSPGTGRQLHGELICYARAVIRDEWKTMRHGRGSPVVEDWLLRIERTIGGLQLRGEKQRVAYDHWFDESAERREGRRGRLSEAESLVPPLVWLALLLGGALIIAYMCFYADPREPFFVQGLMMGAVTTMVVVGMLVVWFLDHPYKGASGSIKPTAMAMTLRRMEDESRAPGAAPSQLCDHRGRPRQASAST
jgi:hypothetical protein